jgi:oxygen-independent coproporphyrinogen-3 oxidase
MTSSLADRYDLRVPRYTSYPTAPHFTAVVGEAEYRAWLAALDPGQRLSLYLHVPFCDSMCWFCACYTKIVQRYQPVSQYLAALAGEIDLLAEALPARFSVVHLHWGGGSPTMLHPDDWLSVMGRLRARFAISAASEIAVELDPRDTTEDYIAALAEAGVNRVSIGVQDFDPEVQAAINRMQPFEVVEWVVGWLRRHGIRRINLDLMYGLPHQSTERVLAMVDKAVRLEPARLALFGYAHVPWMKSHQRMIDERTLPGAGERLEQFTLASRRLREHGYRSIGLDHFARPDDALAVALDEGRLHRNFQGYTTDEAAVMLPLGASAIGRLPEGYVQNAAPLHEYRAAIAAGRLPVTRGLALSPADRLRAEIIERLMCDLTVDLSRICAKHGSAVSELSPSLEALAPLAADGVVDVEDGRVTVRDGHRALLRLVAAAFDAHLATAEKRHSRAV